MPPLPPDDAPREDTTGVPDDRQEHAFEVPDSWTQLVLDLMLEGPMTVEEHEARAAAEKPRTLN